MRKYAIGMSSEFHFKFDAFVEFRTKRLIFEQIITNFVLKKLPNICVKRENCLSVYTTTIMN